MPNQNVPTSPRHSGWFKDQLNNVLEAYFNGTRFLGGTASAVTIDRALTASAAITAAVGGTVTTGGWVVTAGNVTLGSPGAFATTQPTAALKMGGASLGSTAPVGAITTSGGVFASDTVVRKVIADGTVSNVET